MFLISLIMTIYSNFTLLKKNKNKGDIKMKYIAHCKLKNFTTSNLQILFDFINLIEFYSDDYGDLIFIESIP